MSFVFFSGCDPNCKLQCATKYSQDAREELRKQFHSFNDSQKYHFYSEYTERKDKLRERTKNECSRRKYTFIYYFPHIGTREKVCRSFFSKTLDISVKRVYNYYKKMDVFPMPIKILYPKEEPYDTYDE